MATKRSARTFIALLRGVNVGRAKRIAMSDLRQLIEREGGSNVRTLLNSGNAVFVADASSHTFAKNLESAIERNQGFSAATIVIAAEDLDEVIAANPLLKIAKDPARHLIGFVAHAKQLDSARTLLDTSWKPDALAVGAKAAYLWCANGILESRLLQSFGRAMGTTVTTRNWTTVLKLQALAKEIAAQAKG